MIPFLDLQAQYRAIGPELEAAAIAVMRRGEFVLGSSVAAFEKNFATYCGAKHCVALNTGTSALHLAMLALGIGPGDDVITVPMTFVATVAAIRYANATPVLVDIDPETWTMDASQLEAAITPRTKAILPVHLHGRLADMSAIMAIAKRHGIPVIEDCAQAHGAEALGKRAGTFGAIGCFSFYPGKNLGACGEGGAIVTDDVGYAAVVRQLRDWGQTSKYNHERHGFNYRMDGIQGAVLDVKLRYLPEWTERRRAAATNYDELLADTELITPKRPTEREHVYHVYAVRTPDRDRVQAELKAAGVMTNIHYPRPVHLQKAYANLGYRAGDFPASEAFGADTLSLPMFPELTKDQAAFVASAVRRICAHASATPPEVQFADAGWLDKSQNFNPKEVRVPSQSKPLQKEKALRRAIPAGSNLLKGKRVLVTGGAGFVGSHIVDLLIDAGCAEIVVIDNMVRGRPENLANAMSEPGKIKVVVGDIRNTQLMADLIDGTDTVFHQAALRITHCAAEPRAALEVMIKATFDLVEQCQKSGVRKIVMASSASVYGMANAFPTTEQHHPYNNRTLYGAAKAFGEGLLRSFNDMYGTNYVCLRYFNVYGPRMDIHGRFTEVLVRWMERLEAGEPPAIFGNGKQTMDMLHVRDAARANILAAVSPASDIALNVGSGTETSLLSVARHLSHIMGRPDINPVYCEERAVNPVPRRLADTSLARRAIGFETTVPLQEGLAELVDWWRAERSTLQESKVA